VEISLAYQMTIRLYKNSFLGGDFDLLSDPNIGRDSHREI